MVRVVIGELAEQQVSAILRPIRSDLAPIDSISRDLAVAAGPKLADRLERIGSIPLGGAVITPGGELAADFVIHAVVMSEDEAQSTLTVQKALRNGLRRAADWEMESLALPPLGIGAGAIEPETAARALVEILFDHLDEGVPPLDLVVVVTTAYQQTLFEGFVAALARDRAAGS